MRRIGAALGPTGGTVGVVVVDDAFIRDINARYRGKDEPTDVISFSYLEDGVADEDDLVGEVYISHETLVRDAGALGVEARHLFLRIGVHGLLHVLGYDHESDEDAERMERAEREILLAHLGTEPTARLF
jgi:probable rRNA maturation factor